MIPGAPIPRPLIPRLPIPGLSSHGSAARGRLAASRANRRLLIFAAASVALHLLLTATALVAPGLLSLTEQKPLKANAPLPSFEFVVVQKKGSGKPAAPEAADKPAPQAPPPKPEPQPKPEPPAAKPPEPPMPQDPSAEAGPQPQAGPKPEPKQAEVTAAPVSPPAAQPAPKADRAPQINLGGTDSLSSLVAKGSQIIPVEVDAKFRNREPVYPAPAARLGEQGLVVVQIHVAPDGHVEAVGIEKSSGHVMLDEAAREAVVTWHFRPAIDGGVPVPSTISIAIDFTLR